MITAVKVEGRNRTFILVNILISAICSTLLMSALNTALAQICIDIGISVSTGQWLISGEVLAMGIVMPLTAFMMRRFRTKRLYLTSIMIFIAGLVLAMLSPNFPIMMFGRVLQGCGNGMLITMGQVIILSIYPPEGQGKAMGLYGLAAAVSPMVAPTMGGILTDTIGWRSIFLVDLAGMVFAFVMAIFVFKNVLNTEKTKMDLSSFVLSVLGFGGLTLGVGILTNGGFSPTVLISLAVGTVCMIIFVRRQIRLPKPFLDMKILKVKNYTIAVITSGLIYFVLMGSGVLLPLFFQNIMGCSATISGLMFLPGSILMAVINPIAGKYYDKHGIKGLFVMGSLIMVIGFICMSTMTINSPLILPIIYNMLRFGAAGLNQMPLITWGTTQVDPSKVADASALLQSIRTISGSVGSAVFVGIMSTVSINSEAVYGDMAGMHGVTMSFIGMVIVSVVVLLFAVFSVKGKPRNGKN